MNRTFQQGLSSLSLLVVLAVAGIFLTAAIKIGPLYLDNYFVDAALQSLAKEQVHEMTDRQIRRKVQDYFIVNNVRDVDIKDVKISRQKTRTLVKLNYDKRVNFFGNLDFIATFDNVYDSSK